MYMISYQIALYLLELELAAMRRNLFFLERGARRGTCLPRGERLFLDQGCWSIHAGKLLNPVALLFPS